MVTRDHPLLLLLLLLSLGVRTIVGAPCCMDMPGAHNDHHAVETTHHADHSSHDHAAGEAHTQRVALDEGHSSHSKHDGDNTANPCCSACGPTLPPELAYLTPPGLARSLPEPTPVRALATRPPYPAYEATGPPALV